MRAAAHDAPPTPHADDLAIAAHRAHFRACAASSRSFRRRSGSTPSGGAKRREDSCLRRARRRSSGAVPAGSILSLMASSSIADSSANRPGTAPGPRIGAGAPTLRRTIAGGDFEIGAAVKERRLLAAVLHKVVELRSLGVEVVANGSELAVRRCAQANALLGARTMADIGKHHAPVDAELHRPVQLARSRSSQRRLRPRRKLAAESGADKARDRCARFRAERRAPPTSPCDD